MTKKPQSLALVASDFLFYAAPDGTVKVQVLFRDETAWLPQKALAELFGVKVPAINKHLKNIYESGEFAGGKTKHRLRQLDPSRMRKLIATFDRFNITIGHFN